MNAKGLLGLAALLAIISAVVHLAGSALSGFALIPVVTGIVWLLFAAGFRAGYRWLAYIAFLVALAGALTAYATLPSGGTAQLISLSMVIINCLMIVLLFLVIWRQPQGSATG